MAALCSRAPRGHRVAWLFVYRSQALVEGEAVIDELVVLEQGEGSVSIEPIEACRLLLGSAALHDHPLVLGSHSVHTRREALVRGVVRLRPSGSSSKPWVGSERWARGMGLQDPALGTFPRMAWARPARVIGPQPTGCRRSRSTSRNRETSSSPMAARA